MDNMRKMELETLVKENPAELVKSIQGLNKFVQDMRSSEKFNNEQNKILPPVRNLYESKTADPLPTLSQNVEEKNHINQQPDNKNANAAEFFKDQGNKFFKLNEYQSAIKCYSSAIEQNNRDAVFYSNRAACYLKLKMFDQCIKDCTMAIDLDPYGSKAYYRRMMAYDGMSKYDKAAEDSAKLLFLAKGKDVTNSKRDYDRYLKHLKNTDFIPVPNVKSDKFKNDFINFAPKPQQPRYNEQLKIVNIMECT